MQRFKSPVQAQCFLEPFSAVFNHFRPRRHLLSASGYRAVMAETLWDLADVVAVVSRD